MELSFSPVLTRWVGAERAQMVPGEIRRGLEDGKVWGQV